MKIMYHDHFRGWDPFRPTGGFVLLPPFARGRFTRVSGIPRVTGRPSPGVIRELTDRPNGALTLKNQIFRERLMWVSNLFEAISNVDLQFY